MVQPPVHFLDGAGGGGSWRQKLENGLLRQQNVPVFSMCSNQGNEYLLLSALREGYSGCLESVGGRGEEASGMTSDLCPQRLSLMISGLLGSRWAGGSEPGILARAFQTALKSCFSFALFWVLANPSLRELTPMIVSVDDCVRG